MSRSRAHSRRNRSGCGVLPDDVYIQVEPWRPIGRSVKHDIGTWRVVDDWPACVPVTETEIDVFEAWFGDLFDEMLGPRR
jgi:hypothetical protein